MVEVTRKYSQGGNPLSLLVLLPCLVKICVLVLTSSTSKVCNAFLHSQNVALHGARYYLNVPWVTIKDEADFADKRNLMVRLRLSTDQNSVSKGRVGHIVGHRAGQDDIVQIGNETASPDINTHKICKIAASGDGKIASSSRTSAQIDAIYNAINNQHLNSLAIMDDIQNNATTIQTLTESLENSGFMPLSQRDLDLCAALNPGYLLRLSIAPDLQKLDPDVYDEFYPDENPNVSPLFGGRVLIFRRGYSEEVTTGRLLLPKLDYLQSSLVQRSALKVARRISKFESSITSKITNSSQSMQNSIQSTLDGWDNKIDSKNEKDVNELDAKKSEKDVSARKRIRSTASKIVKQPLKKGVHMLKNATLATRDTINATLVDKKVINLERYTSAGTGRSVLPRGRVGMYNGVTKSKFVEDVEGALNPFLVCEIDGNDDASINDEYSDKSFLPTRLLKRVSIANLVDFFSDGGRRRLIKSLFSNAELVEPTFEEIIVIWRPLPNPIKKKRVFVPPPVPKVIYDVLEIFGAEHKLPKEPPPEPEPDPLPIEIRTFDRVPMANLLAVLPKTKLIFRPADALIFDLVNVFSLLAVLASQKFDSPSLDVLAIVSVSLWVTRTFFRYSNKIARYDLVVNKFLTQKISHRNIGALKYIANEAAAQRARRASLVLDWLAEDYCRIKEEDLLLSDIIRLGPLEVNKKLMVDHTVYIDAEAALDDLIDLGLIDFDDDGRLTKVETGDKALEALARLWNEIFRII